LPRTAEALTEFVGELVQKRRRLEEQQRGSAAGADTKEARALEATKEEIAFLDGVLAAVEKSAPWQALDRAFARRDNVALAGAVDWLAALLIDAKQRFPTRKAFRSALRRDPELTMSILNMAFAFPDLNGPNRRAESPERGQMWLCDDEGTPIQSGAIAVLIETEDDGDGPKMEADPYPIMEARASRLRDALASPDVLNCLYGTKSGEPHGPVAAAEQVIASVAGVSRDTTHRARKDLGKVPK
jgi:hypothetical protein